MWHGTNMWKSEDKLGIQFSSFTTQVSLIELQIELRLGGKCLYLLGHLTDPCVAQVGSKLRILLPQCLQHVLTDVRHHN